MKHKWTGDQTASKQARCLVRLFTSLIVEVTHEVMSVCEVFSYPYLPIQHIQHQIHLALIQLLQGHTICTSKAVGSDGSKLACTLQWKDEQLLQCYFTDKSWKDGKEISQNRPKLSRTWTIPSGSIRHLMSGKAGSRFNDFMYCCIFHLFLNPFLI